MSPRLRTIMDDITRKLDDLEPEYRATAPEHLPRSGGPVREYGRMIGTRVRECREMWDWGAVTRERIGELLSMRAMGARYGVSHETVRRYIDHTVGRSIPKGVLKWASTRGAGRPRV